MMELVLRVSAVLDLHVGEDMRIIIIIVLRVHLRVLADVNTSIFWLMAQR